MQMNYRRVFVPNPNFRFDVNQLKQLSENIVYVCDRPMFDELMGNEYIHEFEHKVQNSLKDFNPDTDIVAFYGDTVIFAIIIMYLSEQFDSFDVARFSGKSNSYLVRTLNYGNFK